MAYPGKRRSFAQLLAGGDEFMVKPGFRRTEGFALLRAITRAKPPFLFHRAKGIDSPRAAPIEARLPKGRWPRKEA
jgi:hypothetical protein